MRRVWLIGSTGLVLASTAVTLFAGTRQATRTGAPPPGGLATLTFAIVGDTRPAQPDNVSGYPTAIITRIWQDVAAANPALAVTPGNYMFANPAHKPSTAATQLGLYLTAQANFKGPVYHAMGNQECAGTESSNCGPGNPNGVTPNFAAFMGKMVQPTGNRAPYYSVDVQGQGGKWTAKFVIVAGNAWSPAQAAWLDGVLSRPTTYTFIVRNAPSGTRASPCLAAPGSANNADSIISRHPYTLLIVGHTHTFQYLQGQKEVIVGNGGAPLSGSVNYGYVIARQQATGSIAFTAYDYQTNAVISSFTVNP